MNTPKIIHFIDQTLFTPIFINSFSKISDNSIFYILSKEKLNLEYIDNKSVFGLNTSEETEILKLSNVLNNSNIDFAIFHYLNGDKEKIANLLNKKIKKIWCLWGHDLYNGNSFFPYNQYEPLTKKLLFQNSSIIAKLLHNTNVKRLIFRTLLILKSLKLKNKFISKYYINFGVNRYYTIKKFDAISYIVPKEGEMLKKIFPEKVYLHLYSDPKFPFFSHFRSIDKNSQNIIVGNSAAFTNNHLDAFELLKEYDLSNRKIIVPLSYSGTATYVDSIVKKGYELFGKNFIPLLHRLPLEEYSELLSTCGIAIMNQKRQQSGGNIFHLIGSGVKVFLNAKNGFYDYFIKNDIKVFKLEDLNENEINNIESITENKNRLLRLYSQEHYNNEINKLLNLLNT